MGSLDRLIAISVERGEDFKNVSGKGDGLCHRYFEKRTVKCFEKRTVNCKKIDN